VELLGSAFSLLCGPAITVHNEGKSRGLNDKQTLNKTNANNCQYGARSVTVLKDHSLRPDYVIISLYRHKISLIYTLAAWKKIYTARGDVCVKLGL
jgi:hypothetical protein